MSTEWFDDVSERWWQAIAQFHYKYKPITHYKNCLGKFFGEESCAMAPNANRYNIVEPP